MEGVPHNSTRAGRKPLTGLLIIIIRNRGNAVFLHISASEKKFMYCKDNRAKQQKRAICGTDEYCRYDMEKKLYELEHMTL